MSSGNLATLAEQAILHVLAQTDDFHLNIELIPDIKKVFSVLLWLEWSFFFIQQIGKMIFDLIFIYYLYQNLLYY